MKGMNARAYIQKLDEAPVIQQILASPRQVSYIRKYVDDLRIKFPDVSDSDMGWLLQWISEFVMTAWDQHGPAANAPVLMMTFAVMSRELLLLEAAPETPKE
jgi:hypothetical protein